MARREKERAVRRLVSPRLWLSAALLMVAALSSCALPAVGASPATPTRTPAGGPAGWLVYHGDHFTIAYPPGWSYNLPTTSDPQTLVVILTGPQPRDQIEVVEMTAVAADAEPCSTLGTTAATLAGLPMRYDVVEGVHRVWSFYTSAHISYDLSALDADQSTTMQTRHDSILATFRPDDRTPGCP